MNFNLHKRGELLFDKLNLSFISSCKNVIPNWFQDLAQLINRHPKLAYLPSGRFQDLKVR